MKEDPFAIKVENVSKKFSRNLRRSLFLGTLDLAKSFVNLPPDTTKLRKSEFWSLRNVSFEVKKGEIFGIIGENGSGKSTLLRLIAGIFPPDDGRIVVNGNVGSLIAVGAGFHPHMTGRENIFLNGTILGMSRSEIKAKFDDIVKFADIGDFLDAPVSTYSSGMKVRLGFSIAIHRVPEVLLVDEVLAVGDISFKRKCMERMEDIRKKTSIIFISHDMRQVERICNRVMVIDKGKELYTGETLNAIDFYYKHTIAKEVQNIDPKLIVYESTGDIYNITLNITNEKGENTEIFKHKEKIVFEFNFESRSEYQNPILGLDIVSPEGITITSLKNVIFGHQRPSIKVGHNNFRVILEDNSLMPGTYRIAFKWRKQDNFSLVSATGGRFAIQSEPELVPFGGYFKVKYKWIQN
ncbi:MAG: ABC transporter ATP-binding protein [Candidatus Dojkabacteria bacterium]|nr:MAG: ABC transporter ATP-binding protein [Candidatus Dojkabacteria bacterium]